MQLIRKYLTKLSLLISLLTLLQSCVAYHKTPVSLEQSVKAKTRSKLFTKDGYFVSYKYILEVNDQFYGVKKKSGALVEIPIGDNPDTEVFLKNKSKSKWLTWGLITYSAVAVAAFIGLAAYTGPIN